MEKNYTISSKLKVSDDKEPPKVEDAVPEGVIFLSNDTYEKIFGKKLKTSGSYPWRRGIVKITFFDDKEMIHRSIYRLWRGLNPNYKTKDLAYINVQGQIILFGAKSDGEVKNLILSKGTKLMYYWNNENSVIRCSFKLGLWSVVFGGISLILSVISLFLK